MLPHLEFWGESVSSYLAVLVGALAVGTIVGIERGRRDGLAAPRLAVAALAASLAGVVGARLWSLLLERWVLVGEIDSEAILSGSGFGIMGGLLMGGLATIATARWLSLPLGPTASALAPGVAIGIAIGRLGCLLAGCCYGKPTLFPVALVFEHWDTAARPIGVPLHATQLYESQGAGMLGIALWFVAPRHRLGLLLSGYGMVRSLIEPLRADYRGTVAGVPTTQLAAFGVIIIGLLVWRLHATRVTSGGTGDGGGNARYRRNRP